MLRRAAVRRRDLDDGAEPRILPVQVARAATSPERALAGAVVEQCRADLAARVPQTLRERGTVERRRLAARSWAANETDSGLGSFTWWCHAAGIDPAAALARWRRLGLL